MVSKTTLVNIRATIRTTDLLSEFVNELYNGLNEIELPWFCACGNGRVYLRERVFFSEFGRIWSDVLVESCQPEFNKFFKSLDWSSEIAPRPNVEILEMYEGSWIIEAALIVQATAVTTYGIIKGISEIPKMAEGLIKLKEGIVKNFQTKVNDKVVDLVQDRDDDSYEDHDLPLILCRPTVISTEITIDPRPMKALSPVELCEHAIHMKVNVSSTGVVIENLSDDAMKNLRIGLFSSDYERHNWNFGDAYIKNVISLSGNQTIAIDFLDFLHRDRGGFAMKEAHNRLDCWVQDSTGIYLFNFLLPAD